MNYPFMCHLRRPDFSKKPVSYCLNPQSFLRWLYTVGTMVSSHPQTSSRQSRIIFLIYLSACEHSQKGTKPNHIQAHGPTSKSLRVWICHKNNRKSELNLKPRSHAHGTVPVRDWAAVHETGREQNLLLELSPVSVSHLGICIDSESLGLKSLHL